MRISRPTSGRRTLAPIRALKRGSSGCTATALSPSIVSGRVVATVTTSPVSSPCSVDDRIVEIIEMAVRVLGERLGERRLVERRAVGARPLERALAFDLDDLEVGDRGLELRVPVDQPLGLVDQPLAVQLHEHLGDRLRQAFVEREALAAPVARGAEALELADDRAARFGLPLPHPREKRLAAEGAAVGLLALRRAGARPPSAWRCRRGRCPAARARRLPFMRW